jgi:hypothetical protein
VSVSNCTGIFSEAAFLIGLNDGSIPNSVASLTITDCNLTAPTVLGVAENFGTIMLRNVTLVPYQSGRVWVAPQANHICAFLRPSPLYGGVTYVGSSLSFDNCRIYRNTDTKVAAVILENHSTIANLSFNGIGVQENESNSPLPELLNIGWGSIGQLVLDSLDTTNIKAPVSPGGFSSIGSVSGTGVLATGWEFPDAVMTNEVPYISASTGLPSIKVGGVVEPYDP